MKDEILNQKKMDDCNSWILPKGAIIHYQGIPYYLSENTEILGNTFPKEFNQPSEDDLKDFFRL